MDELEPVILAPNNENDSFFVDRFLISLLDVLPDPDFMLLLQLFVEVKFTAITNSVNVTCATVTDTATLDVMTNSKFMHMHKHIFPQMNFICNCCQFEGVADIYPVFNEIKGDRDEK